MTSDEPQPTRAQINRHVWAVVNEQFTDRQADELWQQSEIRWGLFRRPENDLNVLGDVTSRDIVELGCGTAYFSAWLARQGARPIAIDVSEQQLATAARCAREHDLGFPLIQANGENVPLRSVCADLVVSEHGASVWCDPRLWLAEAARILRPGGRLIFLTNSVLATLCVPPDEGSAEPVLHRGQRDLYRTDWDGGGVEFHPSHGTWISLLLDNGFSIVALHELYAPADALDPEYYSIADAAWSRQWPVEELWVATLDDQPIDAATTKPSSSSRLTRSSR